MGMLTDPQLTQPPPAQGTPLVPAGSALSSAQADAASSSAVDGQPQPQQSSPSDPGQLTATQLHDRLHAAEAEGISHQTIVDTLRGVLHILRQLEERMDDRPDDPEEWQGDSQIRSCMTAASAAYAERRSQAATSPSHAPRP